MIYTVTLNPSLDYILPAEHFALGAVNCARGERILPGGKGINVSRVLKELGVPSVALGFAAGFTGEEFLRLAGECGVRADFLRISGQTRINVKIRAEEETDINAGGPAASEEDLRALAQKLAAAPQGAVLVLAGSVPASLSPECYVRLLSFSGRSDFRIALDAAGRLCGQSLALAPWLVKPNRAELEELVGERLSSRSEIARAARRLQERGARNVLASLGEEGAFLLSESGEEFFIAAPRGEVADTVGAGDSLLAGFIAAKEQGGSDGEALKLGVAAGSATAFRVGLATGEEIRALLAAMRKS